jgi:hypothetical protein
MLQTPNANLGKFPDKIKDQSMILVDNLITNISFCAINDFIAAFLEELARQYNAYNDKYYMQILANNTADKLTDCEIIGRYDIRLIGRVNEDEKILFALMEQECYGATH